MTANGKKVTEGRLERTIPIQFSLGEGLDIGRDVGSPIDFTYKMPFEFSGKIEKVTIELKPEASKKAKPGMPDEVAAVA
jgi:arylsulfatase